MNKTEILNTYTKEEILDRYISEKERLLNRISILEEKNEMLKNTINDMKHNKTLNHTEKIVIDKIKSYDDTLDNWILDSWLIGGTGYHTWEINELITSMEQNGFIKVLKVMDGQNGRLRKYEVLV